jgi:hypothetical protein
LPFCHLEEALCCEDVFCASDKVYKCENVDLLYQNENAECDGKTVSRPPLSKNRVPLILAHVFELLLKPMYLRGIGLTFRARHVSP